MQWQPETEEELDEARKFYEAGNWRSYENLKELFKKPRQPEDYVVRSGLGGYYSYVASREDSFANDVREALVMTHEEAILAVIRLTKEQQLELDHNPILCWEPMRLDDAILCHEKLARASSAQNRPAGPKDNEAFPFHFQDQFGQPCQVRRRRQRTNTVVADDVSTAFILLQAQHSEVRQVRRGRQRMGTAITDVTPLQVQHSEVRQVRRGRQRARTGLTDVGTGHLSQPGQEWRGHYLVESWFAEVILAQGKARREAPLELPAVGPPFETG